MKNNFYVIGGQYEPYCYGGASTFREAKKLADENAEYWDNWEGWNTPKIYLAEDTKIIESNGRVLTYDGQQIRVPKDFAIPVEF